MESIQNEPDDLDHFYNTYITNYLTSYHINNRLSFRESVYQDYFDQTSLWESIRLENETYTDSEQTFVTALNISAGTATTLTNVAVMTLIPYKIIRSISNSLLSYASYTDTNGIS